jgi:hypothetical protein
MCTLDQGVKVSTGWGEQYVLSHTNGMVMSLHTLLIPLDLALLMPSTSKLDLIMSV